MLLASFHPPSPAGFASASGRPGAQLRLGGDRRRHEHGDQRADRLGQDARGVSRVIDPLARRPATARCPTRPRSCTCRRSRRCRTTSRRTSRRRSPASAERCRAHARQRADPGRRAHRRHAAGERAGCAARRRTSSSRRRSRSTSCSRRERAARCCGRCAPSSSTRSTRVAGDKRGAHLALSLERLDALGTGAGRSASVSRPRRSRSRASRASSSAQRDRGTCTIVDAGHVRKRDLALELPTSPLEAVMSPRSLGPSLRPARGPGQRAPYDARLRQHAPPGRARRARTSRERLGEEQRRRAPRQPRAESIGSTPRSGSRRASSRRSSRPRRSSSASTSATSIWSASSARRARSRRSCSASAAPATGSAAMPKGRLFPLTRDELVECAALLDARPPRRARPIAVAATPLDVLAQQIVAESRTRGRGATSLYALVRTRAAAIATSTRASSTPCADMLADGVHDASRPARRPPAPRPRQRRAARPAWRAAHRDHQRRRDPRQLRLRRRAGADRALVGTCERGLRGREHARATSSCSATRRIASGRSRPGRCCVEDAQASRRRSRSGSARRPAARDELSRSGRPRPSSRRSPTAVDARRSRRVRSTGSRSELGLRRARPRRRSSSTWRPRRPRSAHCRRATPSISERFFDEGGGMQLVIHSPFGARVNRAWGLALRKRFCRASTSSCRPRRPTTASCSRSASSTAFALDEVFALSARADRREVLDAGRARRTDVRDALALERDASRSRVRASGGKNVPAQFQRMRAEDLLAAVFPDQLACAENLPGGDREIQIIRSSRRPSSDCLHEAMDVDGLRRLLARIEAGRDRGAVPRARRARRRLRTRS